MKILRTAGLAALLVVALILALVVAVPMARPVTADVLAIPTPVFTSPLAGATARTATFWDTDVLIATGGSAVVDVGNFNRADIMWSIDVGTVNTTTYKLQFSNDATHWTDGVAVASAVVADVTNLAQFYVFGRYARVYATVSNTNPLTTTVIAVLK